MVKRMDYFCGSEKYVCEPAVLTKNFVFWALREENNWIFLLDLLDSEQPLFTRRQ